MLSICVEKAQEPVGFIFDPVKNYSGFYNRIVDKVSGI